MLSFTLTISDDGVTSLANKFGYPTTETDPLSDYYGMSENDFVQAQIQKNINDMIAKYDSDAAVFAAQRTAFDAQTDAVQLSAQNPKLTEGI